MPNTNFKDSDRFNLMLALTAVLIDGAEYKVEELAKHFDVSEDEIKQAVKVISLTDFIQIYSESPYQLSSEDLENGIISLSFKDDRVIHDVSRLSSRQASALAAGLVYLSSLPGLAEVGEIEELQMILAKGLPSMDTYGVIELTPGTADADLAIVREAIARELSISCDYLNLKGETKAGRIIEPLRLEPQGELTYVKGWCPETEMVKSFRIDRMRNAKVMQDRPISESAKNAEVPEDIYTPGDNDVVVTLEVEPEAYGLISDYKPVEAAIDVGNHVKRFKIKVGDVRNLGRVIARFGGAARVIEPKQAREAVRDFALQALGGKPGKTPKDAE
jgi:proteasome accessory factor C